MVVEASDPVLGFMHRVEFVMVVVGSHVVEGGSPSRGRVVVVVLV